MNKRLDFSAAAGRFGRYRRGMLAAIGLSAMLTAPATVVGEELTDVALSVASYPAVSLTPPYMAGIRLGVFEKEGIRVSRISGSGGGGQTVRNVISGEMSFGEVSPTAAAAAFKRGEQIVIVGGGVRAISDIYYVAKKDSPIKTIEDLKGKSVGYTSPGSTSQAVIQLLLEKAGIEEDEVQLRAMGGVNENVTALLADGVDAAVMLEPIFSRNPEPFQVVVRAEEQMPAYQQTVIISRTSFVEENPEIVRRFLKAYQSAVAHVHENPDATGDAWAEETGMEPEIARKVVGIYTNANQWGVQLDLEAMSMVQEAMRRQGLIEPGETFPWDKFIMQDFLPEDVEKLDIQALMNMESAL